MSIQSQASFPKLEGNDTRAAILDRHEAEYVEPSIQFWNLVIDQGVLGFSNAELAAVTGTSREFEKLCESLRDLERIKLIAKQMEFPHASILDKSWLHFRQIQAWTLHGLILSRHFPNRNSVRSKLNMEHDIHDLEYLILGLHAYGLATAETKASKHNMAWRFKIIEPQGRLLTH